MYNIISTGLIRKEDLFKKSIKDFTYLKERNEVDEIVFSTWYGEIDKYNGMRDFLTTMNIIVVESTPPNVCQGSILHQMKSLEIGMDNISNKSLMIFKTRPDLYIKLEALYEITSYDYQIEKNDFSIFEQKVWIPWFEISKPFYLADECFFSSYNDMYKLINYDMKYDVYYDIDAGISHIRRFIHPFLNSYPILKIYLKYLSITGHGTTLRFDISKDMLETNEYRNFLYLYYILLNKYFIIGCKNTNDYIVFRRWSNYNQKLDEINFHEVIKAEYSFDCDKGQIFDYNDQWLKLIIEHKLLENYKNFIVDENKLQILCDNNKKELEKYQYNNGLLTNRIKKKIKNVLRIK